MPTKKELQAQIEDVKKEIEELEILTNVGDMQAFDLIISKIKEDMIENVKEEDWKSLKDNKAKIEKMKSFTDYIEKQTQIIEDKENELNDLQYQLDNYQMELFETPVQKQSTGIIHNEQELFTGDVFENSDKELLLIFESESNNEKFAIITLDTSLFGELLLNYPKNRERLNGCTYLGNAHEDEELQKKLEEYFTPQVEKSDNQDKPEE